MKKIPTMFVRVRPDPMPRTGPESAGARQLGGDRAYVIDQVVPGCEWVIAGEGVPTRKFDGTCVMFDGEKWWGRREVKPGKEFPPDYVVTETDATTGKTVGWQPIEDSAFANLHAEAIAGEDFQPGTYELCGPKVNRNPEGFSMHVLVSHDAAEVVNMGPRTYEALRRFLTSPEFEYEGVVWHHPDGRMAKLKKRDFPRV